MTSDDDIVWYLRVTEQDLGSVVVLVVEGRVSSATATDLDQALARPDTSRLRGLIVDLSGVDYINSVGLRAFEAAAARMQECECELVVCGLRPVVRAGFEMAGLIAHLTNEPSLEAAIRRLRGQGRSDVSALG